MESRVGRTLALAISSLAMAGCAASAGFLRDSVTQVQVKQPNFRIVKTGLAATADTDKVFCVFPTDDAQVYRRLMENLHASARLGPNQMLVNLREDIKFTFYLFFYCSEEHTVSADVVEFLPAGAPAALPPRPPAPRAAPGPHPGGPGDTTGQAPSAAGAGAQPLVPAPAAQPPGAGPALQTQ